MKCRYCKAEIPEGELYCKKNVGERYRLYQITIHLKKC